MVAAVLFTWPDRRFGPAATNLFRVKGMTEILRYRRRFGMAISGAGFACDTAAEARQQRCGRAFSL
jgi:hypothetical protein